MRGIGSAHGLDERLNASGDLGRSARAHYGTALSCALFRCRSLDRECEDDSGELLFARLLLAKPAASGNALLSIWGLMIITSGPWAMQELS